MLGDASLPSKYILLPSSTYISWIVKSPLELISPDAVILPAVLVPEFANSITSLKYLILALSVTYNSLPYITPLELILPVVFKKSNEADTPV